MQQNPGKLIPFPNKSAEMYKEFQPKRIIKCLYDKSTSKNIEAK